MFDRNRKKQNSNDNRNTLVWKEEEQLKRGSTVGTISSAVKDDGSKIYSWCLGKEGRGPREGQTLKFMDPRDFHNAHDVIDDVDEWIEEDRKKR
ncbi:MAG: hypothetical protein ACYTEX_11305 [Planctomycetota bacterium]|jgi:hypothetical protein